MSTDTEIRSAGLRALSKALGHVEAERFVALMLREPFDYTDWQRSLWDGMDVHEISSRAMAHRARENKGPDL